MTRHARLALVGMMLALWAFSRACNTAPAESQPGTRPSSATWAPAPYGLLWRLWLPVTGGGASVRDWRWDQVAVAYADKPTLAPTPTRTPAPTDTRPPRPTRQARATGTPTQGNMLPPPTCGPGTVEPGLWTPWPACYPHGGSFTPTPTASATHTPYPTDTPPASATWEPTPSPRAKATPAAAVTARETWRYRFPIVLVRRASR